MADDRRVVLLASGEADAPPGALRWRAANVYHVRDGQVVECRVFVENLYTFD